MLIRTPARSFAPVFALVALGLVAVPPASAERSSAERFSAERSSAGAPAALPVAPPAAAFEDLTAEDRRRLREAEEALEGDQPTAALETAQLALEYSPNAVLLLDVASRAAAASGHADLALHYANQALAQPAIDEDSTLAAVVSDLERRIAELDPNRDAVQAQLDAYGETLFDLGKSAARRDLWANAVDFFQRCDGTAIEEKAQKELEKIFKKDEAIEALVASGLDIEFEDGSIRKSPEAIAKIDEKSSEWDDRLEVDTKGGYTIESNGGYLFTHMVARAMDQANLFLRDMYQHKVRGQRMRGAAIQIYKSHDDFTANEDVPPGVLGWFSPNDNLIVTYKAESDAKTLVTLFHEASHQFMRDVTKNTIPGWISEGVACYFEGTELLPNGKVLANMIPWEIKRLDSLKSLLGAEAVEFEDVITFFQGGSPPGAHYPYGWGLVYFMRNYEDENGVRVYRPHFDDFVATYKGGGNHNVKERFVEYFVERPDQPDVKTFDDFYEKWKAWILDLHELNEGGPEMADRLVARGDVQHQNGFHANAVESYRWALDKRPGDIRALYGLARANQALENDDVALYYFRAVLDWALSQPDGAAQPQGLERSTDELVEEAMAGIKEVNDDVAAGILAANDVLADSLLQVATQYRENDFPRRSVALLERTTELVGPRAELLELCSTIIAEAGIDQSQKRRLRVDPQLSFWSGTHAKDFSAAGDDLAGTAAGSVSYLTYAELPPTEYRFETTIELTAFDSDPGAVPCAGIYFGSGLGVRQLIGYSSRDGGIVQLELTTGGLKRVGLLERVKLEEGASFELAVAVDAEGEAQAFFDGKELEKLEVDDGDTAGQVGLFLQNAKAKYSGMRFIY